jgi:hypothetical protein
MTIRPRENIQENMEKPRMVPVSLNLALLILVGVIKDGIADIQSPKGEYNADDVISSIKRNWRVLRLGKGGDCYGVSWVFLLVALGSDWDIVKY